MTQSWHDVVATLARPAGAMQLIDAADWDANVVAEVDVPGGLFRGRGDDEEQAWRSVAHSLGDFRIVQALEAAGWTDIDEVIDQVTYVVARDREGALWAIGVATADGARRGFIASDIESDDRDFDRIAFVEPLDTLHPATLNAALDRAG